MPSSMSGVVVGDDVKKEIENLLKYKKSQYVVFSLGKCDNKDVWEIKAIGERKEKEDLVQDYNAFIENYLKPEEAVFALYDFSQLKVEKVNVVALQWCPDTLGVTIKMKFASSVDPLKKLSEASSKIFAKNERDEVEMATVLRSYPTVSESLIKELNL